MSMKEYMSKMQETGRKLSWANIEFSSIDRDVFIDRFATA